MYICMGICCFIVCGLSEYIVEALVPLSISSFFFPLMKVFHIYIFNYVFPFPQVLFLYIHQTW